MIDDKADIFMVAALARVKDDAKANERAAKEVSAEIRAKMEANRYERERAEL